MAANINDKISKISTGIRPKVTSVAGVRATAGTTLTCDDLTGWTTDTAVHFVTYKADAQGKVVPGSQTDMKGVVSGNTIINLQITGGNDDGNAVGDIVQQLPTAGWGKDLADGLLTSHNPDGTLIDNSVTSDKIDFVTQTITITSSDAWDAFGNVYYRNLTGGSFNTPFSKIISVTVYNDTIGASIQQTWLNEFVVSLTDISGLREFKPTSGASTSSYRVEVIGFI